jgi:hypothetical protein
VRGGASAAERAAACGRIGAAAKSIRAASIGVRIMVVLLDFAGKPVARPGEREFGGSQVEKRGG